MELRAVPPRQQGDGRVPPAKLRRWAERLWSAEATEVFAYFNNDPGGAAARDADRFRTLIDTWAARVS